MQSASTIFVSIASYRDPELVPTLLHMIDNAQYPENLNISVFWQDDHDKSIFLNQGIRLVETRDHLGFPLHQFEYKNAQIGVIDVHYYQSKGACWARHRAEELFQDEKYFLQIDSHCRFTEQWDHNLIAMLNSLKDKSPKPVLTSYPPGYEPGEDEKRKDYVTRLMFDSFTPEGMLKMSSMPFKDTAPVRCGYLAAGFVFADGSFVRDIPNDPEIFFLGEEIAMAARAFTHGYDTYAPNDILLWHFYTRVNHSKVWSDHNNKAKEEGAVELAWWERDKIAKSRVRALLGSEEEDCDLGHYSLGTTRSLQEFEYRLGIHFKQRLTHLEVVEKDKLSYFKDLPQSHDEWINSLVFVNKKNIKVEKLEADFSREDVEWWRVGIYNQNNEEIRQEKIDLNNKDKFVTTLDDATYEINLNFNTEAISHAHKVRICPFIATLGWGEEVEKFW